MKSFFKKAILPVAVFGIAIAAAFATTYTKEEQVQPIYTGVFYYQDSDEYDCVNIEENLDCTLVFTDITCTWNNNHVYGKEIEQEGIACSIPLYKRTL